MWSKAEIELTLIDRFTFTDLCRSFQWKHKIITEIKFTLNFALYTMTHFFASISAVHHGLRLCEWVSVVIVWCIRTCLVLWVLKLMFVCLSASCKSCLIFFLFSSFHTVFSFRSFSYLSLCVCILWYRINLPFGWLRGLNAFQLARLCLCVCNKVRVLVRIHFISQLKKCMSYSSAVAFSSSDRLQTQTFHQKWIPNDSNSRLHLRKYRILPDFNLEVNGLHEFTCFCRWFFSVVKSTFTI